MTAPGPFPCSGGPLPPSPPAEKAAASKDESRQPGPDDRPRHMRRIAYRRGQDESTDVALRPRYARTGEGEYLGNLEWLSGCHGRQHYVVGSQRVGELVLPGE